ncbi:DnaJ-domain-containing protein [Panus rudis PR-1116 ss-1]|nr:DnaJ-domain-containing protein [Panus rudis PR-1116 ss-1]
MPVSTTEKNFYAILELPQDASEETVKVAYKKLALKWHPDRHLEDKDEAQQKFIEINDAYTAILDSIHNPPKRKHRDKPKSKGSEGVPSSKASSTSSTSSDTSSARSGKSSESNEGRDDNKGHREETPRRPSEQSNAKASKSPGEQSTRPKTSRSRPSFFSHLRSDSSSSSDESDDDASYHERHRSCLKKQRPSKSLGKDDYEFVDLGSPLSPLRATKQSSTSSPPKDWIFPLPLSLEDLSYGASHRYRVTRTLRSGKTQNVKIDIKVSPGWRKGTRIRVPGVGNERKDGTFQDIVFVVEELPHPQFTRVDDDLYVKVQVPWLEDGNQSRPYSWSSHDSSLDGGHAHASREDLAFVKGLDGEEFALPIPRSLVEAADGSRIIGAGMPVRTRGQVDGRGDLVIKWEFIFPENEKAQKTRWQSLAKAMKWK